MKGILREYRRLRQEHHATGFIRLEGSTVGVCWPTNRWAGRCLDIDSKPAKAARFVRFCDAFRHSAADTGGCARALLPGVTPRIWRRHQARREAVVLRTAKATVPKVRHQRAGLRGRRNVVIPSTCKAILLTLGRTSEVAVDGAEGGGGDPVPVRAGRPRKGRRAAWTITKRLAKTRFVAALSAVHRRGDLARHPTSGGAGVSLALAREEGGDALKAR